MCSWSIANILTHRVSPADLNRSFRCFQSVLRGARYSLIRHDSCRPLSSCVQSKCHIGRIEKTTHQLWTAYTYPSLRHFQSKCVYLGVDGSRLYCTDKNKNAQRVPLEKDVESNKNKDAHEKPLEKDYDSRAKQPPQPTEMRENVATIPNMLCVGRMVASPVLGYLVLHDQFTWALGIFACAAITDILDGYIARNFKNQSSHLGSVIDPLADKILLVTMTVTLTMANLIPVPLTVLIVGRDLVLFLMTLRTRWRLLPPPVTILSYMRVDVTKPLVNIKPSLIGKVNTLVQVSLVATTLAAPVFGYIDHQALQALWYATALTTFFSGVDYITDNSKVVNVLQDEKVDKPK